MAIEVRRKPWERFSTVRQNAFARIGDIEDLTVDTFNVVVSANEDLLDITDASGVFTTAQAIDIDLASYTSGVLIDIDLATATIDAGSSVICIVDDRDHDGIGADAYRGLSVIQSGDFPGTTGAADVRLLNAEYTGIFGASGANASLYGVYSDLSGTLTAGAAINAGYFADGEATVLLADKTSGVDITVDADTVGITVDAVTTDHSAGNLISIDIDAADIAAGSLRGVYVNEDELVAGTDGTFLTGFETAITGFATGRADLAAFKATFDGSKTGGDSTTGLLIDGGTFTINNGTETLHGVEVAFASVVDTDFATGEFNAVDITMPVAYQGTDVASAIKATGAGAAVNVLSGAGTIFGLDVDIDTLQASNALVGIDISKDLTNASAGAGIAQTNSALNIASVNANTEAQIMTVANNLVAIQETNSADLAGADVYSGTVVDIGYAATTTTTGTATSSATGLLVDYDLTETAGTLTADDFDVVSIDYDTVGTPDIGDGNYNLLNIVGTDAGVPDYGTCTLSGANIDISAIDTTDATLTLYGLNVTGAAAGTSTVAAARFTDGTQVLTLSDGDAHITSTTSLITDMPVPAIGADILNATALVHWMPFGTHGAGAMTKTEFYIDLVGLSSVADDGDAIGDTGQTTSATLGQYTVAVFGTIAAIEMVCIELPAGGTPDIDLYSDATGTHSINDDVSGGTHLIDAGGNWVNGMTKGAVADPTADHYFYLTAGAAAAGDYTTGKFIIRFYGVA